MASPRHRVATVLLTVVVMIALGVGEVLASGFGDSLAQIDAALAKNPGRVNAHALRSCRRQRNFAVGLYERNQTARAERSLKYCFQVLQISERAPERPTKTGPSMEDVQQKAAREIEQALVLTPDLENGLAVYRGCAECHMPEGWGYSNGLVPQLAGQHQTVVVKQLADIRAGNRATVVMAPYATVEVVGGAQAIADVAGYIDTLEISTAGGKGPGDDLELGEGIYRENCARCHGAAGEGNAAAYVPRIQAQHFNYLVRQFEWIRDGKRRNGNAEMKAQIEGFDEQAVAAVLDYVSRLEPSPELVAPPGWSNPDFAE